MANNLSANGSHASLQGTGAFYHEASSASSQQFSSGINEHTSAKSILGPNELEMTSMLHTNQRRVSKSLLSRWWPELTCCIFIFGPFGALFGTIYPYVGKPLPEWPYGLSINTLISIYSVIFTTALMMVVASGLGQLKFLWFQDIRRLSDLETFDQAAKGPWGALILLWVLRARHLLSSTGALVVVLSIFVAPFSQQLVKYIDCVQPDVSAVASIPRTNTVSSTGGFHVGAALSNVDILAQAAVNTGLYDSTPAEVKPVCPTGNCTFVNQYTSAGYCHECRDYTDRIIQNGTGSTDNVTIPGWDIGSDGYMYAFVLGQSMTGYPGVRMIYSTIDEETRNNTNKCDGGRRSGNWTCLGIGAAECSVRPCVRKYSGSVKEGVFKETVQSSTTAFSSVAGSGVSLSLVDLSCINQTEADFLRESKYTFSDDTEWLSYNLSEPIFSDYYNASTSLREECIYQASQIDTRSLDSFFTEYFSGYVSINPRVGGEGSSIPGRALYNLGSFNFTYIDTKFRDLATSLTVYARNKGSGVNESEPALGEVKRVKVCVGVRWQWITLEAFLLVAGLVFFALTVWVVEKAGDDTVTHDYKTSVLPLLFHGLDSQAASRNSQTMSSVENQAKHIRVKLTKDETGWGFVDADGQSLRSAK